MSAPTLAGPRLAILAAGTFVLGVDSSVLAGLLPAIARSLHVSAAHASQLTTAFAVTYALGSPLIATVTGRLDRRTVILAGMAVFLTGICAQALGPTYLVVLGGRIVAALGAAAFQANAYAIAGAATAAANRARSMAAIGAGSSLAAIAGVPLGVVIGQHLGWRAAVWGVAAGAVVAAALCTTLPSVRLPAVSLHTRLSILRGASVRRMLLGTALQLLPQYMVFSFIAVILGTRDHAAGSVLAALFVYGVAYFLGNRLVGRVADHWGPLRMITIGLSLSIPTLVALSALRHHTAAAIVTVAVLGIFASFQLAPQQARVYREAGEAAILALSLNGSTIYLGIGAGAALAGAVAALAAPGAIPLAAAVAALIALVYVRTTAPERQPTMSWSSANVE